MRLIDADAVEKVLRDYADDVGCNRGEYELANGILKAVGKLRDVPTAYDPEKVVAELEVQKERYEKDSDYWDKHSWKDTASHNDCYLNSEKADCFGEAIEIVRKGGAT